eukprot:2473547-Rhodomonas_salina.1
MQPETGGRREPIETMNGVRVDVSWPLSRRDLTSYSAGNSLVLGLGKLLTAREQRSFMDRRIHEDTVTREHYLANIATKFTATSSRGGTIRYCERRLAASSGSPPIFSVRCRAKLKRVLPDAYYYYY